MTVHEITLKQRTHTRSCAYLKMVLQTRTVTLMSIVMLELSSCCSKFLLFTLFRSGHVYLNDDLILSKMVIVFQFCSVLIHLTDKSERPNWILHKIVQPIISANQHIVHIVSGWVLLFYLFSACLLAYITHSHHRSIY